jgi:serine phosphatase RsbU (regulator of sigma subunit)
VSGEGVSFGDERLRASVENSLPQSAESILDALLARVQDFAHGSILVDDITLMIAIREP